MPQEDARPLVISLTRACIARGVVTIPFQRRPEFMIGALSAVDGHGQVLTLTVHEDATISGLRPLFTKQDLQPNDDLVLTRNADGTYALMLSKKPRFARKSPPAPDTPAKPKPKAQVAPQPQRLSVTELLHQQTPERGVPQRRVMFPRDEPTGPTAEQNNTPAPEVPPITYTQAPAQVAPMPARHAVRERVVLPADWQEEKDEDAFAPEPAWRQAFNTFADRVWEFLNPDQVHKEQKNTTRKGPDKTE